MTEPRATRNEHMPVTAHAPKTLELDWRVPIASLAVLVCSVLGGGFWLGSIDTTVARQELRIAQLEASYSALLPLINKIQVDLAVLANGAANQSQALLRIEAALDAIRQASKEYPH